MKPHPICPEPACVSWQFEARLEWNVVHFNVCISGLGFPADLETSLVVSLPFGGGCGGCGVVVGSHGLCCRRQCQSRCWFCSPYPNDRMIHVRIGFLRCAQNHQSVRSKTSHLFKVTASHELNTEVTRLCPNKLMPPSQ